MAEPRTTLSFNGDELSYLLGAVRYMLDEATEQLDEKAMDLVDKDEIDDMAERAQVFANIERRILKAGTRLKTRPTRRRRPTGEPGEVRTYEVKDGVLQADTMRVTKDAPALREP